MNIQFCARYIINIYTLKSIESQNYINNCKIDLIYHISTNLKQKGTVKSTKFGYKLQQMQCKDKQGNHTKNFKVGGLK